MLRTSAYYQKEYIEKERSLNDIAAEHNTYTNKIRREVVGFGYALRDRSEAQKIALKTGRHKHPTKGRSRPVEVRNKIAASVTEARSKNATPKED